MTDEKKDDVKDTEDKTSTDGSSLEEKKDQVSEETLDLTKKLEDLQSRLDKSEEITGNMKSAMKADRDKYKKLRDALDEDKEDDPTKDYDPEEMKNFLKAAKAAGLVTKSDIDDIKAKQDKQSIVSTNTKVYQDFLEKNESVFGKDAKSATKEQDKNLSTFGKHLLEVFDLDKNNILSVKNLGKKLDAALAQLKSSVKKDEIEKGAVDRTMAASKNAELLSVGSGGSSSNSEHDSSWNDRVKKSNMTPTEALVGLRRMGYTEAQAKEIIDKKK